MAGADDLDELQTRRAPLDLDGETFRALGHHLVDRTAELLTTLPDRPVAPDRTPSSLRTLLGNGKLPAAGTEPFALLDEAASLLFDHSTFNSHPRFWGYITSSAAPIGALGDLLAAAVNANVGGWPLAPIATEIEAQTVRWIAALIGYPTNCGGLLVSGGNMANFVGFLAARKARAGWDVRTQGLNAADGRRLRVYASEEAHTWLQKAADLFGLGTDAIRWVATDVDLRMSPDALRHQIAADMTAGDQPFLVIGTAGSVSTGAIDPLPVLAEICRDHGLWFHVDGAYGAFATLLPDSPSDLRGIAMADSVAVDPHKWLYAPLEAGCIVVRDPVALRETFSYHPPYYYMSRGEDEPLNYHEYGPQNSRGFRALKVWLALRQVGRDGYVRMIADDVRLSQAVFERVAAHPALEAVTQSLSITTFRYVPSDLAPGAESVDTYLNELNSELLTRLQSGGEVYVSNAVINGRFLLRACIVNFRTTLADIEALPGIVARVGAEVDEERRPAGLPASA